MNDRDVLLQICVRCDDKTLEKLSRTPLWNTIFTFIDSSHFWHLRAVHISKIDLFFNSQKCYRKTYQLLFNLKYGIAMNKNIENTNPEPEQKREHIPLVIDTPRVNTVTIRGGRTMAYISRLAEEV